MVDLNGPFLSMWCLLVRNQGAHHLVRILILVSFRCSYSHLPLSDREKMEINTTYFILNLLTTI